MSEAVYDVMVSAPTAHTKSMWYELEPLTEGYAEWVELEAHCDVDELSDIGALVDIAVGAIGAEGLDDSAGWTHRPLSFTRVIRDCLTGPKLILALPIAKGERIAARVQTMRPNTPVNIKLTVVYR